MRDEIQRQRGPWPLIVMLLALVWSGAAFAESPSGSPSPFARWSESDGGLLETQRLVDLSGCARDEETPALEMPSRLVLIYPERPFSDEERQQLSAMLSVYAQMSAEVPIELIAYGAAEASARRASEAVTLRSTGGLPHEFSLCQRLDPRGEDDPARTGCLGLLRRAHTPGVAPTMFSRLHLSRGEGLGETLELIVNGLRWSERLDKDAAIFMIGDWTKKDAEAASRRLPRASYTLLKPRDSASRFKQAFDRRRSGFLHPLETPHNIAMLSGAPGACVLAQTALARRRRLVDPRAALVVRSEGRRVRRVKADHARCRDRQSRRGGFFSSLFYWYVLGGFVMLWVGLRRRRP